MYTIVKTVNATFKTDGKKEYKCSVCGKKKSVKLAKLGAPSISKLIAGKKLFTASWKKVAGVDGYQFKYSLNKKCKKGKKYGTKTVTVKKQKTVKKTVKKLKAKKTYYVRIRAYKVINGKKQYSKWSKIKKVKTK